MTTIPWCILQQSARQVVYEDLYDTKDGWRWSRPVVRPDAPQPLAFRHRGSHRAYPWITRLSKLAGNRTQLTLRARRRPYGIGGKNPPKSTWERETGKS